MRHLPEPISTIDLGDLAMKSGRHAGVLFHRLSTHCVWIVRCAASCLASQLKSINFPHRVCREDVITRFTGFRTCWNIYCFLYKQSGARWEHGKSDISTVLCQSSTTHKKLCRSVGRAVKETTPNEAREVIEQGANTEIRDVIQQTTCLHQG